MWKILIFIIVFTIAQWSLWYRTCCKGRYTETHYSWTGRLI